MSPSTVRRLCVGLALALAAPSAGGCSFLYSEGPPLDHRERQRFSCTESFVVPIADVVATAAGTAYAVSAKRTDARDWDSALGTSRGQALYGGAAWALTFAASAAYGFWKTESCRRAQSERAIRLRSWPAAPAPAAPNP